MSETNPSPGSKYRKLRIAWPVGWGILCLLLIALWVRSYWYSEAFNWFFSTTKFMHVSSDVGQLFLGVGSVSFVLPSYYRGEAGLYDDEHELIRKPTLLAGENQWGFQVGIPYWLLLLGAATLAALPWFRWRFSLRTLLIAATLIAVILYVLVWAVK
ncbi:MAG: hypothetical protein L0228_10925 [Planctomycetes bacterium]|nr:hypothetical protein [Planctomycetota bacterium]